MHTLVSETRHWEKDTEGFYEGKKKERERDIFLSGLRHISLQWLSGKGMDIKLFIWQRGCTESRVLLLSGKLASEVNGL